MPISDSFYSRLSKTLPEVVKHFGTPFHIYDETGIRETGRLLIDQFSGIPGFREYFAVKALPNPKILTIMQSMGFGFDCSSIPELILSRNVGATGEDLMFTSNNTSRPEFLAAFQDGGSIINLDDITLISKLPQIPELICFRYNPGMRRAGNSIIGKPEEAKYGVHHDQILAAYQTMKNLGVKRFGIHTMLASNERNYTYMVETANMLLALAESISQEIGIRFDFLNIGGGLGIPYKPEDSPLDIVSMASEITQAFHRFADRNGTMPKLYIESGRYMTGPHGALVVTAINEKNTYRKYIGVDASMSALMRPAMYGSHHEITVYGKEADAKTIIADVVGSLCENNDKFAIQRPLPEIHTGDLLIIHDTGAHGHAMGFNYNGKLRPKELLLRQDGGVEMIRREETIADHFATLQFEKDVLIL